MPRRNKRERYTPLDLTIEPNHSRPATPPLRPGQQPTYQDSHEHREAKHKRELARIERQAQAAQQRGIDWAICLVPGCGESPEWFGFATPKEGRNTDRRLPLCDYHTMIVWRGVEAEKGNPRVILTSQQADAVQRAEWEAKRQAEHQARLAGQTGDIYFLRQNGYVKVGWSSDLYSRLRAYGPDVDLICHYPASRADETALHRQLRAELIKGREWYDEGPLIRHHITDALKRHGPPQVWVEWTEPVPELAAKPRARARR